MFDPERPPNNGSENVDDQPSSGHDHDVDGTATPVELKGPRLFAEYEPLP